MVERCGYETAPGVRCVRASWRGGHCRGHRRHGNIGSLGGLWEVCTSCENGTIADPEMCLRCGGCGHVSKIKGANV